jgi:hypothetical protein
MTMEGLRSFLRIALILALALVLLVFLGFGAYSIFLIAKSLIGFVKWTLILGPGVKLENGRSV